VGEFNQKTQLKPPMVLRDGWDTECNEEVAIRWNRGATRIDKAQLSEALSTKEMKVGAN